MAAYFRITLLSLLLTTFYTCMAQKQFNYTSNWKIADSLIQKNLPQSAAGIISKIYDAAKKERNNAQLIKALVYKAGIVNDVEEDEQKKTIGFLNTEIKTAAEPARQILHSILAAYYLRYFEQNRWKIYERTDRTDAKSNDLETWAATNFHETISATYKLSLANPALLQATQLSDYSPIIIPGNTRQLRPTLFDLLSHEALQYFSQEEISITKPAYFFRLNDEDCLSDAKSFIKHKYTTTDSGSHLWQAVQLYQQLLAFHQKSGNKAALADVDIARLKFVYDHSIAPNRETLYLKALSNIFSQFKTEPFAMQAGYLMADYWFQKGNAYEPGFENEANRYALKEAAAQCQEVIKIFPKSEGGINAQNLLNQLNSKHLSVTSEKVNLPHEPFRLLVKFKNIDRVYFRVVNETSINEYQGDYWNTLATLKPINSWQQPLPAISDLRQHSAEIKVDALKPGNYLLIASNTPDFLPNQNVLASIRFSVSNISFVNSGNNFFILHRKTGLPLAKAMVNFWVSEWDYNTRKNKVVKAGTAIADAKGKVIAPMYKGNFGHAYRLQITHNNETLFLDEALTARPITYNGDEILDENIDLNTPQGVEQFKQKKSRYFLFTDRALYRPGQKVLFKAIGVTQNAASFKSELYKPTKPVVVKLMDANYQEVSSLSLTPNDFGSINGQFSLPAKGLTGDFSLSIEDENYSNVGFKVEEYKRPKFFVTLNQPQESYSLNDTVRISGNAKAFAGNAIDGAKVKYTVNRSTRFLEPWIFWTRKISMPTYGGREIKIADGELQTDANGQFTVAFPALADAEINPKLSPAFDYSIEVIVVDKNGESHDENITTTIGYKTLELDLNSAAGLFQKVDELIPINVSLNTLNNQPQKAVVHLQLHPLLSPATSKRERYWEAPDTFVLDKSKFEALFPLDEFASETDYHTWAIGNAMWKTQLPDTSDQSTIDLPKNLAPGWYALQAVAYDKNKQATESWYYFSVYSDAQLPVGIINFSPESNLTVQPGNTATFSHAIQAPNAHVLELIENKANNTSIYNFPQVNTHLNPFGYAVNERDRGGFDVHRIFILNNRVYKMDWRINVPYTNKELNIELQTFRNKLLPGQQEKWSVKITGSKKELVAAELLASMYDASLDQIYHHQWELPYLWPNNFSRSRWNCNANFKSEEGNNYSPDLSVFDYQKTYESLRKITAFRIGYRQSLMRGAEGIAEMKMMAPPPAPDMATVEVAKFTAPKIVADEEVKNEEGIGKKEQSNKKVTTIQIRKDFRETAFFYPDLHTDSAGNISFEFSVPEALTTWKMQLLAHTSELALGYKQATTITQKDLMVQPNIPRFLRQGDKIELAAKLVNMGKDELTGAVTLELLNATTMKPVDGWLQNIFPQQYFTVAAGQSSVVKFPVEIPVQYTDALLYRFVAKAGNLSDGEEMAIPVLSNRLLVTEALPLNLRNSTSKDFTWNKLIQSANSPTLQHQSLTVEFTTNPVWYAIQSLPYLMEYPYDCAEQTWNRFYANALAASIANSLPKIKAVFEQWKGKDTAALLSNLQKNEQLKSALLEETPWVMEAKSESEQKKRIAQLFDVLRMDAEAEKSLIKLEELQSPNGGFTWFEGGPDDRYMTQYIISGMGHLKQLKAWPASLSPMLTNISNKAITYLDTRMQEDYNELVKHKADLRQNHLSATTVHYLYMRSFFPNVVRNKATAAGYSYYLSQALKYWTSASKYEQGMIALALHRQNDSNTPKQVLKSLTENSITNEEFGMYWKEFNNASYYWWQAPVESHALLLEAFAEIENNQNKINDLKTWLLKQKQTSSWKSTKATADACYALLCSGSNWVQVEQSVKISLGKTIVSRNNAEAGTGYFSTSINGEQVRPEMGKINVSLNRTDGSKEDAAGISAWGAAYWQYFENLENITPANTPLSIGRKLYLVTESDRGKVMKEITSSTALKPGDKVNVHLTIATDRNMEYLHLKDMRAACLEPMEAISGYKFQGGLGYYQSIRDASMNYFISYLPKGTWVLEYPLVVTHAGKFGNGISSIQCMYAPEFTSHSAGIIVNVQGE